MLCFESCFARKRIVTVQGILIIPATSEVIPFRNKWSLEDMERLISYQRGYDIPSGTPVLLGEIRDTYETNDCWYIEEGEFGTDFEN